MFKLPSHNILLWLPESMTTHTEFFGLLPGLPLWQLISPVLSHYVRFKSILFNAPLFLNYFINMCLISQSTALTYGGGNEVVHASFILKCLSTQSKLLK